MLLVNDFLHGVGVGQAFVPDAAKDGEKLVVGDGQYVPRIGEPAKALDFQSETPGRCFMAASFK